jgi:hypothetical protein
MPNNGRPRRSDFRLWCAAALLFCRMSAAAIPLPSSDGPLWVDGTPLLADLFRHLPPPQEAPSAPRKDVPPRFDVGHRRNFFAVDFRTTRQYTVSATLRAVGDVSYIYVADDQWNRRVAQRAVDGILRAFEKETPADSRRGIYDICVDTFGEPLDVDDDPRIVLLLLDIPDNSSPEGTFVAGYFTSVNQQRGVVRDSRWGVAFQSNETEMLYLDTNPARADEPAALGVLAHEMQHLLHYGYDPLEETWLNEGASEYAMYLCGYPPRSHVRAFESDPHVSLTDWPAGVGSSVAHYGGVYLWTLYLHERYGGEETLRALVQSRRRGIESVEQAIRARGAQASFGDVFSDWRAAMIADDERFGDGRYGVVHESVRLRSDATRTYPVGPERHELAAWSADVLELVAPAGGSVPLQVDIMPEGRWSDAFRVRALLFRGESLVDVRDVSGRERFVAGFREFGVEASRAVLSVEFQSRSAGGTARYDFAARLGEAVTFRVSAFRNPVQPVYLEVLAVPDAPVQAGAVALRLSRAEGKTLEAEMRSLNEGRAFAASFRAPADGKDEWAWELTHFGQVVGKGTMRVED